MEGHRAIVESTPKNHAGPCQPAGLEVGPSTAYSIGPCQPGPVSYRAVPCSDRAKMSCHGPGRRASGSMTFYSCDPTAPRSGRRHLARVIGWLPLRGPSATCYSRLRHRDTPDPFAAKSRRRRHDQICRIHATPCDRGWMMPSPSS